VLRGELGELSGPPRAGRAFRGGGGRVMRCGFRWLPGCGRGAVPR
jgi:hypothetical protein